MKIELINENQIKCTLTRSDLAYHQIRLSELAYGTEKTKDLFQDMMDQAFTEFGFEADSALMIEAIPVSMDCIVLMITKLDETDDVDQGFSGLSSMADFLYDTEDEPLEDDGYEDLNGLIGSLTDEFFPEAAGYKAPEKAAAEPVPQKQTPEMIFSFDNLERVIEFAHRSAPGFKGESTLYKSPDNGRYYMILANTTRSVNLFGHICNLALEYGSKEPTGFARGAFMGEHYEVLIPKGALQKLADV